MSKVVVTDTKIKVVSEGKRGYSAYEVAVKNGYTGTEAEWVASLKGDKGDQGIQGVQGIQGIQGEQGIQGVQGVKGDTGNLNYDMENSNVAVVDASLFSEYDFFVVEDGVITGKSPAEVSEILGLPSFLPPGIMMDYAGSAAPSGWLLCDGSEVSQGTYSALYTIIGSTYNTGGEAEGNFRLPDLRGRVSVGIGQQTGGTNFALGAIGGEETSALTTDQIPQHNHEISGSVKIKAANTGFVTSNPNGRYMGPSSIYVDSPSQGLYIANAEVNLSTADIGGNEAHNNLQPYLGLNKIIKY